MVDLRPALEGAHEQIEQYLAEMHERGHYILGPHTEAFERDFAEFHGASEAIGVGTGTAALELCLRAAGIRPGDHVIVPAMTSLFTAQAVLAVGGHLRIADVDPSNLLLTVETASQALTPQTRAIIAVHLYGQPCELDALAAFCDEHGIALIQDACQAHGAFYRGIPLTQFSAFCAYSFYPTKNLGALGDGGAVLTSSVDVASTVRLLRDGGRMGTQMSQSPALNSRLDEMQCCYLRAFLPHLASWNERRRELATLYKRELTGHPYLQLLSSTEDSVHHLVVARSPHREAIRTHLDALGIQTGIHYPVPIHEQPGFLPYASWAATPEVASRAAMEIFSLPAGPHVTEAMASRLFEGLVTFQP